MSHSIIIIYIYFSIVILICNTFCLCFYPTLFLFIVSFALDACLLGLSKENVHIELLTDMKMLTFCERAKRGGFVGMSNELKPHSNFMFRFDGT